MDDFSDSPFLEPSAESTNGDNLDAINQQLDELEDSMDDVGQIKRQFMPRILADDDEFNSSQVPVDTISKKEVENLLEAIPKPMVQKPIQPGSSPSDQDNRFLCWNNTGIIRAKYSEGDQCIDIMFHDTERHSSINFQNEPNYTFGSMSDEAIVVGSNGKYGTGPSSIHGVNLLEMNRDQQKWVLELPPAEIIEALAVGSGFIALATDQRNLRLFSNGGMQSYMFTLPGQIVCMVAHEHQMMIIYHNGSGHSDDQNLAMFVYYIDLQSNIIRQTHAGVPVALSKRSPLSWAGFSDEGTPCVYDYSGILRMYRQELGKSWVPLLNLKDLTHSALDHYFVVGVSEISQVVRAVKCRRSRYPDFATETAELFQFSLPMCDVDTDRGKLEEEHMRLRLAELSYKRLNHVESLKPLVRPAKEDNEKLLVNTVLRLFATYIKEDKEDLAKSLVYMIPKDYMSKLPEFAWKVNRPQYFIDALNRTIEEREELDNELKTSQEEDSISIVSVTSHPSSGEILGKEQHKLQDSDVTQLKPIPLEKLLTNTHSIDNNNVPQVLDDDSGDEDDTENCKQAKRTKQINYNLFSKNKRPKVA